MAKGGRRAQNRRTKEFVLGTLALLVVATVIAVAVYLTNASEPSLDKSMCPAGGPKGHFVLLVDKTDPLTFTQKEAFLVTLRELIQKRTPEGYMVSIFVLGEDFKENPLPLIEMCNPGNGAGKTDLTANLKRLRQQYEEKFVQGVMNNVDSMLAQKSAKWSPIFEMLQLVSINSFKKHSVAGERRLIVISDMLHNTQQFTMYKGVVDYPTYAASDYGKKTQLDLHDVKVELNYLMNTPQLQTTRNLSFWEAYFNKADARVVVAKPL